MRLITTIPNFYCKTAKEGTAVLANGRVTACFNTFPTHLALQKI